MGVVMLGAATLTESGLNGSVFQMFAHGHHDRALLRAGGLVYEKAHSRAIFNMGGFGKMMPGIATAFTIGGLSSLGLPATAGFVAEFLTFLGAWQSRALVVALPRRARRLPDLDLRPAGGQADLLGPAGDGPALPAPARRARGRSGRPSSSWSAPSCSSAWRRASRSARWTPPPCRCWCAWGCCRERAQPGAGRARADAARLLRRALRPARRHAAGGRDLGAAGWSAPARLARSGLEPGARWLGERLRPGRAGALRQAALPGRHRAGRARLADLAGRRSSRGGPPSTTCSCSPRCSGMLVLASARDLILLFVAFELMSIPLYVLAGFQKGEEDGGGGRAQVLPGRHGVVRAHRVRALLRVRHRPAPPPARRGLARCRPARRS